MEDKKERPILIIFAGPNGSGKSSNTEKVRKRCKSFPNLYINADDIAAARGLDAYAAAMEAEKQRQEALTNGLSFVMETVMSSPEKIKLMREARDLGYYVHLEYVVTQDPFINLGRVKNRVAQGGHNVPGDKILSRYERSRALLPEALDVVTSANVMNNSLDNPVCIAEKKKDGTFEVFPQDPPSKWSANSIRELIGIRETPPAGNVTRTVSDPLGWLDTVDGSKLVSEAEKAMRDIEGKGQGKGPVETQEQDSGTRNDAGEYDFDGPGTNRPG